MKPIQKRLHLVVLRLVVLGVFVLAAHASAQIGFEPPDYQGSDVGVSVTGQAGWYRPDVVGRADQSVYTYDGNVLGLPANAFGETQFLGGMTTPAGDLPRAQWDFDWSAASVWTVTYDIAAGFGGTLPAADNLSSFSLQDSIVARYFIAVNTWVDPTVATHWNSNYIVFTADDQISDALIPGLPSSNLAVPLLYQQSTTFDFHSHCLLSITLTDPETR